MPIFKEFRFSTLTANKLKLELRMLHNSIQSMIHNSSLRILIFLNYFVTFLYFNNLLKLVTQIPFCSARFCSDFVGRLYLF
jgi:hypothetical protein